MAESQSIQRRDLQAIGEVVKQPHYLYQFTDAFFHEYVETRYSSLKWSFEPRPDFLRRTLFDHLRAAMYVYRQLNFKRLLLAIRLGENERNFEFHSFHTEFASSFADAITDRYEAFLVDSQRHQLELLAPQDLSGVFIPAFLRSTDAVLQNVTEDVYANRLEVISQLDERYESFNKDIPQLMQLALSCADGLEEACDRMRAVDHEIHIPELFERYRQALLYLDKPTGIYGIAGADRLLVAGLEIDLLKRLNSLPPSISSLEAGPLSKPFRAWHSAHGQLLTTLLKRPEEQSNASKETDNWQIIPLAHQKLGGDSQGGATIPLDRRPDARLQIEGVRYMAYRQSRTVIGIFASGLLMLAFGTPTSIGGLFYGSFFAAYCGIGLIAAGLSIVTLTLFRAIETQPNHQ